MQSELDIRKTSIEAYHSLLPSLSSRQSLVYNVIKMYPGSSNLDLCRIMDIPINSVTPRVKELRELGLVVCIGTKQDRVTKRSCMVWSVKE